MADFVQLTGSLVGIATSREVGSRVRKSGKGPAVPLQRKSQQYSFFSGLSLPSQSEVRGKVFSLACFPSQLYHIGLGRTIPYHTISYRNNRVPRYKAWANSAPLLKDEVYTLAW